MPQMSPLYWTFIAAFCQLYFMLFMMMLNSMPIYMKMKKKINLSMKMWKWSW